MNAHTFPTAQRPGQIERELSEIDALVNALRKRRLWLEKASHWQSFGKRAPHYVEAPRFYCSAMKQADHYQVEILDAAYRLVEIDAIHDKFLEMGGGE